MTFEPWEVVAIVIMAVVLTAMYCYKKFYNGAGDVDGVFIINKNDPTKDPFSLQMMRSPLDTKQGDILRFSVHEHYISQVEDGHKEETND